MRNATVRRAIGTAVLLVIASLIWEQGVEASSLRLEKVAPKERKPSVGPAYVAVQTRAEIHIDGDLSEWRDVEPIVLNDKSQAMDAWRDPQDLSARAYLMWDESHLYFACDVEDDVLHRPGLDDGMWAGDAIQMGFDPLHDASDGFAPDDYDFAFALTGEGPGFWRYTAPLGRKRGSVGDIELEVVAKAEDKGYIYEMAIPWGELVPFVPLPEEDCGFTFVVADDDGEGFKGGLQWTRGIWYGKYPSAFGDLVLRATAPPQKGAEVFMGMKSPVVKGDEDARIIVVINSARRFKKGEIKAKVLSEAQEEIAQLSQRLGVDQGVTRLEIVWPAQAQPAGEYVLGLEVYGREGERLAENTFPVLLLGDLIGTIDEQLGGAAQEIKSRAKTQGNPLLGIRALDVERRKADAFRLLDEVFSRDNVEAALSIVKEGEVIGRLVLEGKRPSEDSGHFLMRLAADINAQTVWESSVDGSGEQRIGVYYSGIPIAVAEYNRFPTPKELDQRLQLWFQWDRMQGYQIVEKPFGEYQSYVVTEKGQIRFLDLAGERELYVLQAINEEVAWRLAEELVALDGITAEEIEAMHATMESNPTVDAQHVEQLLGFDYASSMIVVGEKAGRQEKALAEQLATELGGEVVSERKLGDRDRLVVVGTRESNSLIRDYESDGILSYPHADQGLLTYSSIEGKRVIFVAGGEEGLVGEAGRALLNLVTVLRGRQLLVGDLHMHTVLQGGMSRPFTVARATIRNYMDFASITDHDTPLGSLEAIEKLAEAGIDYTLLPGQETSSPWGHWAVIGCEDTISRNAPAEEAIRSIHAAGGVVIVAHTSWTDSMLAEWVSTGVDGFEARSRAPEFYPQWKKMERVPSMVSSTDSHSSMFSHPARTLVFAKGDEPEDILEAIRTGYCLGYTMDKVYGPEVLINVFNTLFEEGSYLKAQHLKRLAARVASL